MRQTTYFFLVETHEPVAEVVQEAHSLGLVFAKVGRMCKVNPRDPIVFPAFAERILVIQQRQLLNDVVHDQINVNGWLLAARLLISFAQLANHGDVEALIWIQLEHAHDYAAQLWRILFTQRRKFAFSDSLKQIVKTQILFVVLPERTTQHAKFVGNAPQTPHITLPVVSFALQHLRTHIERSSHARKGFKSLRT